MRLPRPPHESLLWIFALLWFLAPQPLHAHRPNRPTSSASNQVATVVVAEKISWHGFVRYWRNFAHRTDRIVLIVGLVAATALFIITRGRWLK